jgi:hypothetical protein
MNYLLRMNTSRQKLRNAPTAQNLVNKRIRVVPAPEKKKITGSKV